MTWLILLAVHLVVAFVCWLVLCQVLHTDEVAMLIPCLLWELGVVFLVVELVRSAFWRPEEPYMDVETRR